MPADGAPRVFFFFFLVEGMRNWRALEKVDRGVMLKGEGGNGRCYANARPSAGYAVANGKAVMSRHPRSSAHDATARRHVDMEDSYASS